MVIEWILEKEILPQLIKTSECAGTNTEPDPLQEFLKILTLETDALTDTPETPNTKIAMMIMDGLLDILNFVSDHDFDLAMQRMISLWENFFPEPIP